MLVLWAATAGADEPDAAVAPAGRWSDPAGTPSGGRRSAARPLLGEIEEAWSVELPGTVAHAPVLWDGTVYVLCNDDKDARILAAVDLYSGRLLAKKGVPGVGPGRAVVWGGIVYFRGGGRIVSYRRLRNSIKPVWKSRDGEYSDPIVWDDEIYVVNHGILERLRRGSKKTVWERRGSLRGRVALYGDAVYVMGLEGVDRYLYVYERRNGAPVARKELAPLPGDAREVRRAATITVAPKGVYVLAPNGFRAEDGVLSCAEVQRIGEGETLRLGSIGLWDFPVAPSVHRKGVIASYVSAGLVKWGRRVKDRIFMMTDKARHPGLFDPHHPATVVGDVVYFGNAAIDIRSDEVLWRLPAEDLTHPPVPADGRVLVVVGGESLRCYQEAGRE